MRGLAVALLLLAACGAGTRSPTGAVRALAEAAQEGDRDAVWRLLGPATRARLTEDARRAAQLAGRRSQPPEDMLAVGWFPPRWHLDDAREVTRDGDRATVEVSGAKGDREQVTCVRVGGAWKVELP